MKIILSANHGIMTGLTDASWPDRLERFLLERDTEVHVVKRKYFELPTPRLNWFKNRWLSRALANELQEVLGPKSKVQSPDGAQSRTTQDTDTSVSGVTSPTSDDYSLWFVAHSNGAVVSLMAARRLIARGYKIGGMILTGAAIEADLRENRIFNWYCGSEVFAAIAYSSPDDEVTDGAYSVERGAWKRFRAWLWGKLMWPYGCLGRTGWLLDGKAFKNKEFLYTRWQAGGHSTYFTAANSQGTFEQMYADIAAAEEGRVRNSKLQTSNFSPAVAGSSINTQ